MAYTANQLDPQITEVGEDVTVHWDDEADAYIVASDVVEIGRTDVYSDALAMARKAVA